MVDPTIISDDIEQARLEADMRRLEREFEDATERHRVAKRAAKEAKRAAKTAKKERRRARQRLIAAQEKSRLFDSHRASSTADENAQHALTTAPLRPSSRRRSVANSSTRAKKSAGADNTESESSTPSIPATNDDAS